MIAFAISIYSALGISSVMMLLLTIVSQFSSVAMIRAFSRDPAVIAFGSDYLRIVSFNFIAAGIAVTTSSAFQGIGNTLPPLISFDDAVGSFCLTRHLAFAPGRISNPLCLVLVGWLDLLPSLLQSPAAPARVAA